VLNTRVNWTRFIEPRPNLSTGFDMTTLGFPVATNFGASLFQSNLPRRIQMALRLTW